MNINKKNIASILRESVFSPKYDRMMNVIADVEETGYYMLRAEEEVAKAYREGNKKDCSNYLKMAISLLAIARIKLQ